jgi:hypothetical protein
MAATISLFPLFMLAAGAGIAFLPTPLLPMALFLLQTQANL